MLLGMGNHFELWDADDLRREGNSGNGAGHARRAEEFHFLTRR